MRAIKLLLPVMFSSALVLLSSADHLALAQGGTLEATAGPPKYKVGPPPSPAFVYVVFVNGVKITATITNLDAKKASETNAQASQRKAKAIIAALNASINTAITDGKLPVGTPLATLGTQPNMVPNVDGKGNPLPGPAMVPNAYAGYGMIILDGVTQVGGEKDGFRDPSGEPKGIAIIKPGRGSAGAMGGAGATSGLAAGIDPFGAPTVVSFGLFAPGGLNAGCTSDLPPVSPCPGDFIASVFPTAGEDDEDVLSALASAFNSLYASDGFTATYDPLTDLLFLDQPLTELETLFVQNTDPGLDLVEQVRLIPAPASIVLVGIGLFALAIPGRLKKEAHGASARRDSTKV